MKENYDIEFEELEFIRKSAPQLYEDLNERFRKYAISNSNNMEETLKEMFQDDQYMMWLEIFTEQYEMFDTENWLEIETYLEKEDVVNIYRLELLVDAVQTYYQKRNLKMSSHENYEECILVYGMKDDVYRLQKTAYLNGQDIIYGVNKVDMLEATDMLDSCSVRYDDLKEYVKKEMIGKHYQR